MNRPAAIFAFFIMIVIGIIAGFYVRLNLNGSDAGNGDASSRIRSFAECEAAGYPVQESYPRQCMTPDGQNFVEEVGSQGEDMSDTVEFSLMMQTIAVQRVGQPIEGFDAMIYREAFPGLTAEDFEGVATTEGVYQIQGDGELKFVRALSQPITSAEQAINAEGHATLYKNLRTRFGDISLEAMIDALSEGR